MPPKPKPDDIVEERWESGFGIFSKNRFLLESDPAYVSDVTGGALRLRLLKKRLFAWAINPLYRYRDLVLEGECAFDSSTIHGALGFILRRLNDDSYYYFLISNRLSFRFDLVFNGNPIPLIPWTPCPNFDAAHFHIRIIARGGGFSFYIDNKWLGEVEDDSIDAGGVAFAAQNYEASESASFLLKKIIIDSLPVNVETQYLRWTKYAEIDSAQRLNLARTLYGQAQYAPAVVQIKKAAFTGKLSDDDILLMGDCLIRLALYQEGLGAMENLLERKPGWLPAVAGKASCLYGLNRFTELRDFLASYPESVALSSVLCDFLGNAESHLGNDHEAGEWYARAADMEPDMPIFHVNAGRAFLKKNVEKAALHLRKAMRLFFRQEAYDDVRKAMLLLNEIFQFLEEETSGSLGLEMDEISGKLFFEEGKLGAAEEVFTRLIQNDYGDSSVYYLQGIILQSRDEMVEALHYFQKAAEMEPDAGLYWFRLAECLFLLDLDCEEELLKALDTRPDDPWTLNLAGQVRMADEKFQEALPYLEKAMARRDEAFIRANYAECLYKSGKTREALTLLDECGAHPLIFNQKGNLLAREGMYMEALSVYRKALASLTKDSGVDSRDIRENMAEACIEGDLYSEAEAELIKLLDEKPTVRVYLQLGRLAEIKGEYRRAESLYLEGLRMYPDNSRLLVHLGWLSLKLGDFGKAEELAKKALNPKITAPPAAKSAKPYHGAAKLLEAVRGATETVILCASCGRTWTTPKTLPPQGPVKLRGEPRDESPAGKCTACNTVYCVACAKENIKDGRFVCRQCGASLKLSDDHLRYLVTGYL